MDNKNKIKLEDIPKKLHENDVPEGYFDQLHQNIMSSIPKENESKVIKFKTYQWVSGIAASIALILTLVYYFGPKQGGTLTESVAVQDKLVKLPEEELLAFAESNPKEEEIELVHMVDQSDVEQVEIEPLVEKTNVQITTKPVQEKKVEVVVPEKKQIIEEKLEDIPLEDLEDFNSDDLILDDEYLDEDFI